MHHNAKHEEGNLKKGEEIRETTQMHVHAWAYTFFIIMIPATFCKVEHTHNVSFLNDSVKIRSMPSYLFSVIYSTAFDVFNPLEVVCWKDNKQSWVCLTKQYSINELSWPVSCLKRESEGICSITPVQLVQVLWEISASFCSLQSSARNFLLLHLSLVFAALPFQAVKNILCLHTLMVLIFAIKSQIVGYSIFSYSLRIDFKKQNRGRKHVDLCFYRAIPKRDPNRRGVKTPMT